jgi:peptidoglycan L-alanyl-D-glutamate endopeptidase CwlK
MPLDNFRRLNLDLVYPPLLERLFHVIAECNKRGKRYIATAGYRSYTQQDQLYCVGRSFPGKRVTGARGGESQHNFGLAVDFVYDINPATPGVEPSWADEDYDVLIEEVIKAGLHSGINYKDRPHVGWPKFVTGDELDPIDAIYGTTSGKPLERLQRVWQHVDNHNTPYLPEYPEKE